MTPPAPSKEIPVYSRFLNVGGIRTHYLDSGDGPPVVLLHSGEFGGSADLCWEYNIAPLAAAGHRVIAPDWLGFGRTDKLRDFVSGSDRMVRHMAAFLETMAIDEADFVGASMGATTLLRESSSGRCRFPIRRMVLASGGGFVPDNPERRKILDYDGTPEAMEAILRANFTDPAWYADREYIERRVAASIEPGAWEAVAAARFKSPATAPRTQFGQPDTIAYENIPFPTLAVAGGADQLREPGYHSALERIPDSKVVVLDGAGHLLNIERAEEFNTLTVEFLA
ncbi:2-hydroxymuconate-semialdehyde hydrolase [Rhodococcus sp. 27YEA15]|uniref:alpha/beta fold hydrolase n=1 Tax=Rhodococcus sp. 27YEA15 TaxID=3156259 RepID=UPI003C7D2E2E